ncbi:tripartite tricarboxylate transporter substrate binding protein [Pigmentiphaga litoralis]|uniref:Tripartite-type tricarboxylate transporter receptor subunit TctC n=1 Tax=Pigmentiphaga litoralis TaxID=516702 RepID=A0A7Y9IZ03_9BURK|nr:tripartite tricarboxylate transporter substrate binding protein [Pigmentiphaga litoralis]NYE26845.1 tripartite-type tricarboxylate transporter receptor subunit TctC [Pigmentiphaga litoralis]NYE85745.1 tripartite-type tricarboxylate transporter receptor subunit TctC [Pigmentiphaga litoralis]
MKRIIRTVLALAATLLVLPASAQIGGQVSRIVVPFAAGGARELLARTFYTELGEALGRTMIIESRPGAGGAIGTTNVARAEPDGKTLLMAASSHFVTASLAAKPSYDPVKDFVPVANIGTQNYVLMIGAGVPAKNVAEFVAYAKKNPGKLNYGSAGIGSSTHLAMAYFLNVAGADMLHVPYKSTQEAANEVAAGRTQAVIVPNAGIGAYVQDARLRIIGVTSKKRSALLPDVPTVAEGGLPSYAFESWFGLLAPAGTPKAIVDQINAATAKVLASDVIKQRLASQGVTPDPMGADAFNKLFLADRTLMAKVVKDSGLTPE